MIGIQLKVAPSFRRLTPTTKCMRMFTEEGVSPDAQAKVSLELLEGIGAVLETDKLRTMTWNLNVVQGSRSRTTRIGQIFQKTVLIFCRILME